MNILVIDDNEIAADLMCELLTLQDHEVRCAYDARTALALFREQPSQVALIDLTLPDMSGSELATQLRTLSADAKSNTLLVAITGMAEDAANSAVFDHFLQKPVEFDALDAIIADRARAG